MKLAHIIPAALCLIWSLCSCSAPTDAPPAPGAGMSYATHLSIASIGSCHKVKITGTNNEPIASYLLIPDTADVQTTDKDEIPVRVPMKSLVANTEILYSILRELDATDAVTGLLDAGYIKSPEVKKALATGSIADMGSSTIPSVEKLVKDHPQLVAIDMYEGMQTVDLSKYGINYLMMADGLEGTPLGRAEWIKLLGLLTGKEQKADSIFKAVERNYNSLCRETRTIPDSERPVVMMDKMYEGVWYTASGQSYMAALLHDAGAKYPWADTPGSGSLALSMEEVYTKAANADVWLIRTIGPLSKATLAVDDKRYTEFKPYKLGKIYVADTSTSSLFEDFPFHPELLLKEYINIFYPQAQISAPLRYHEKIKER